MNIAVSKQVEEHLQVPMQGGEVSPGHLFQLYFRILDWKQDAITQRQDLVKQISKENNSQNPDEKKIDGLNRRKRLCADLIESYDRDEANRSNLLQAYRDAFPREDKELKNASLKHISKVDCLKLAALSDGVENQTLLPAIRDRQKAVAEAVGAWIKEATLQAPLVTGIGREHPTENGFAFLDPYGLPYLPGSSVKGVLRRAAEELALFENGDKKGGWTLPAVWWLFGFDENASYAVAAAVISHEKDPLLLKEREAWAQAGLEHTKALDSGQDPGMKQAFLSFFKVALGAEKFHKTFGKDPDCSSIFKKLQEDGSLRRSLHARGSLDFWDVLPKLNGGKIRLDILNPHNKSYYQGTGVPGTFENPEPHYFLTVPPDSKLRFIVAPNFLPGLPDALKGKWQQLLESALDHAGRWLGFGAKTAVGYGRTGSQESRRFLTANELWPGVTLKWDRGRKELTAQNPDRRTARATADAAQSLFAKMPQPVQARLNRNGYYGPLDVTVEGAGNAWTILAVGEVP